VPARGTDVQKAVAMMITAGQCSIPSPCVLKILSLRIWYETGSIDSGVCWIMLFGSFEIL
jgi:hypothetical protein